MLEIRKFGSFARIVNGDGSLQEKKEGMKRRLFLGGFLGVAGAVLLPRFLSGKNTPENRGPRYVLEPVAGVEYSRSFLKAIKRQQFKTFKQAARRARQAEGEVVIRMIAS